MNYTFQLYNRHAMYLASQVGSEFHPLVSKLSESMMATFRQFLIKSLPFLSSLEQAFSTRPYLAKLVGICLRCEEDFLVPNDLSFLSSTSPMIIILNNLLFSKFQLRISNTMVCMYIFSWSCPNVSCFGTGKWSKTRKTSILMSLK